ncbi:hypothetical protein GCM10010841_30010 [Deinococcus aerophilus]|uniref:Uncharacterized protein n=1 Tax=Deinococcus aerophilus TaxID=522488 RepID=A0ABQ2H081_9DEIO|nr:hypothetical protein GCM10010841_30010 [Deinococcus aerophilus]
MGARLPAPLTAAMRRILSPLWGRDAAVPALAKSLPVFLQGRGWRDARPPSDAVPAGVEAGSPTREAFPRSIRSGPNVRFKRLWVCTADGSLTNSETLWSFEPHGPGVAPAALTWPPDGRRNPGRITSSTLTPTGLHLNTGNALPGEGNTRCLKLLSKLRRACVPTLLDFSLLNGV